MDANQSLAESEEREQENTVTDEDMAARYERLYSDSSSSCSVVLNYSANYWTDFSAR